MLLDVCAWVPDGMQGRIQGGCTGGTCPPIPFPMQSIFLPRLPLLAEIDRNTLIEQSLTLIKHLPTNTEFVIMFMLNFK